jgi:cobalt/nickel transport system permease protein
VQAAILLAGTHNLSELLLAMRALRFPRLLVAVMGLMWRYLYLIVDEAARLMRARQARSGEAASEQGKKGGTVVWRAKVTGGMAGSLLLRSFERSERVYAAMLARGYDGEVRSLPVPGISTIHRRVLWTGLAVLVVLLLFGILLGGA